MQEVARLPKALTVVPMVTDVELEVVGRVQVAGRHVGRAAEGRRQVSADRERDRRSGRRRGARSRRSPPARRATTPSACRCRQRRAAGHAAREVLHRAQAGRDGAVSRPGLARQRRSDRRRSRRAADAPVAVRAGRVSNRRSACACGSLPRVRRSITCPRAYRIATSSGSSRRAGSGGSAGASRARSARRWLESRCRSWIAAVANGLAASRCGCRAACRRLDDDGRRGDDADRAGVRRRARWSRPRASCPSWSLSAGWCCPGWPAAVRRPMGGTDRERFGADSRAGALADSRGRRRVPVPDRAVHPVPRVGRHRGHAELAVQRGVLSTSSTSRVTISARP